WFDSAGNIVYAVGDDGASDATVPVRRGTISGTTITWGTQATVTVSTVSFAFKATFITKDSSGFLWIASNSQPSTGNYDVAVVKSTNADDVSVWGSVTTLLSASIANSNVYPTILPLSSGNMYAFWYANGAIDGKIGTGTWGSLENIASTPSGIDTSTITKAGLTSPYSVSGGLIGFLWNQGNTTPYEIKIAVYVPEFGIVEIPLAGTLVLLLVLRARWRRSPGSHSSEREDRES